MSVVYNVIAMCDKTYKVIVSIYTLRKDIICFKVINIVSDNLIAIPAVCTSGVQKTT